MPKTSSTEPDKKDTLNKNLDIPESMPKYKARKLLILIRRFDRMAVKTPGQVPIDGYIKLLNSFETEVVAIKREKDDKRTMDKDRDTGATPQMGKGASTSEHSGVSADNPLAW